MPFGFSPTEIPDVVEISARAFDDERGFFLETFKQSDFNDAGIEANFVQDNASRSHKGVFRGLHYQNPPAAQGKLVRAGRGEILDVAVDIRRGSPTFGQHVTRNLSDVNGRMLWIPAGFAHGFLALTDGVDVAYKVTAEFSPDNDAGIMWNDPAIGLRLPFDPKLSDKDRALPMLADANNRFTY
jgi:dTDP-4-dehydrorhamnose 3,5-epimerase